MVHEIHFPEITDKIGLGVGMDLKWQSDRGFHEKPDRLADATRRFIEVNKKYFSCLFFSFQKKNQNVLNIKDYESAYNDLISCCEGIEHLSLHQTRLNMASCVPYEKKALIEFTNELIEKYNLKWVNEDLGFWSLKGKSLPYPLPPLLTQAGLQSCIQNISEYQRGLKAPLLVEFPSFAKGSCFRPGMLDPLEYFSETVRSTNSACTLDTAHILSFQWMNGNWGKNLFKGLNKLPLESCFEIHLSGCEIQKGHFMDFHHGVLMNEQIELLEFLLDNCPMLKVITYEDPVYKEDGTLIDECLKNFHRMQELVDRWI